MMGPPLEKPYWLVEKSFTQRAPFISYLLDNQSARENKKVLPDRVLVPALVTVLIVPPPLRPDVTSYWLVTTLNSRMASIDMAYGPPMRLLVPLLDVGFFAEV